jgi:hypothetical protein
VIVETLTFRLADGVGDEAFLTADRRVQTEFAYRQPGLLRRTVARSAGDGGGREWIVIDLWASAADADACDARWATDPVAADFMACVDAASVRATRYETLG